MMGNWPVVCDEETACNPVRKAIICKGDGVTFYNNKHNCKHLTYSLICYYGVINRESCVERGAADPESTHTEVPNLNSTIYFM